MTELSIPQAIELALAHHSAGRLDQAEHIYRQVLTVAPQHSDALHLLGVIAHQAGQHHVAIELINKAIQINPNVAAYFNNIGEAYRAVGNMNASESSYRRAIELGAEYPDPWSNLAIVFLAQGRVDEAIASAQKAIEINPNFAAAYVNLGDASAERNPDLALAAFSRALELNPNLPSALSNMGYLLAERGHLEQAVAVCRRSVEIAPERAEGYLNLSYALAAHDQAEEAIVVAHRALELRPDMVDAYTNLGFAYDKLSRMEDVAESFKKALQLNPMLISAWKNLGVAQFKLGRTEESRDTLKHALEVDPEHHESRLNYAAALLSLGDYEQGWREYECRWKYDVFAKTNARELKNPWDGSNPAGKSLLIISEQGLGDTLQFIRYAPILVKQGARVISASPPLLHALVKTVEGVAEVCHTLGPYPPHDLEANLMSLPLLMKTKVETIPQDVPYIKVPQEKLAAWKQRIDQDPKGFRVGLSWAGSPKHAHDRLRSTTFQSLMPLAKIPDIVFYTLQLGEAAKQTAARPAEMTLVDHTADLTDFSDTAALISHLDLIISVDTALVHLAGALALPVWTLLPVGPDLRWFKDRSDSPWYPTMRLFRLMKLNDWAPLIEEVAGELRKLVDSR